MDNEEQLRETFKDHVAVYRILTDGRGGEIEQLIWKNPNSGFYAIYYLRWGNFLFVCGDCGEATYMWNESVNLRWIAQCDLGYFHGKCRAAPNGREFHQWNKDVLLRGIESNMRSEFEEMGDQEVAAWWRDFENKDGLAAMHSPREWEEWLELNGELFFKSDDPSAWPTNGYEIDIHCRLHFFGLQMAMKQVDSLSQAQGESGRSASQQL